MMVIHMMIRDPLKYFLLLLATTNVICSSNKDKSQNVGTILPELGQLVTGPQRVSSGSYA